MTESNFPNWLIQSLLDLFERGQKSKVRVNFTETIEEILFWRYDLFLAFIFVQYQQIFKI